MKLIDMTVHEFIKELDSASPAPGGGSASALSASMGMALSRMIGHLTIPKKKFKNLDDSIQEKFIQVHENIKSKELRTLELIDEDTKAFNEIMQALKMPKDSEKEKNKRKKALEKATFKATEIPLEIAKIAHDVLDSIDVLVKYGLKHAISDVGVSALLIHAGMEGACLNVKINLSGLSDEAYVSRVGKEVQMILDEGRSLKDAILNSVHNMIE